MNIKHLTKKQISTMHSGTPLYFRSTDNGVLSMIEWEPPQTGLLKGFRYDVRLKTFIYAGRYGTRSFTYDDNIRFITKKEFDRSLFLEEM